MRVSMSIAILAALLGLCAGAAQAQSEDERILEEPKPAAADRARQSREDDELDDEELDEKVFYSGFGIGRVESDFVNLDPATNLEAVMGFRIPTAPWFGLELDLAQTIIPGENQGVSSSQPISNCSGLNEALGLCTPGGSDPATFDRDEFGMQALGISAVLKTTGRFYVTARYGYRYVYTSIDELNEDRSSNGFGAGVGYRWGKGLSGVELSYRELGEDLDSIGLVFFVRPSRR